MSRVIMLLSLAGLALGVIDPATSFQIVNNSLIENSDCGEEFFKATGSLPAMEFNLRGYDDSASVKIIASVVQQNWSCETEIFVVDDKKRMYKLGGGAFVNRRVPGSRFCSASIVGWGPFRVPAHAAGLLISWKVNFSESEPSTDFLIGRFNLVIGTVTDLPSGAPPTSSPPVGTTTVVTTSSSWSPRRLLLIGTIAVIVVIILVLFFFAARLQREDRRANGNKASLLVQNKFPSP
eukprot:TRINITY_DN25123_c0_g1_i1.p1 TRINITY_DN25123_c0_g1~~TRINITY_DN25123_c0_g1_i1.p1  ORF type:complete len:236 (+),score=23.36 TRINITY_DN25123_c0_g1_i1:88-795(+)